MASIMSFIPEWRYTGVFIVNFEQIWNINLVFSNLALMN